MLLLNYYNPPPPHTHILKQMKPKMLELPPGNQTPKINIKNTTISGAL